jgi:arylformamidase
MLTWPGDPAVELDPAKRIARGDAANVSLLRLGTHTGTHVDPPFHFIDGAATADELDPAVLVGRATVADLRAITGNVGPAELEALALDDGTERLLLRTPNSDLWRNGSDIRFPDHYTALDPEGARWCVEHNVRLVGTDFLSIEEKGAEGHPTHVTLLEAGVVIVEGLDLHDVDPGVYTLICAPLKIGGGDGAPARVFLTTA